MMPTVLVLAGGKGERYLASGGRTHKLKAVLGLKTVLEHVLHSVKSSGLPWFLQSDPMQGMGDSIATAVRATANSPGWLILPADLPLIQPQTLCAVANRLLTAASNEHVIAPVYQGRRGHPVGFGENCRDELLKLSSDSGARQILQTRTVIHIDVTDVGAVTDIDTVSDLEHARMILEARKSE